MGPLEKVDLEYKTLQNYIRVLDRIDEIHPTKLPMLVELSRIMPKDTWLKKIQFKKGKMKINQFTKLIDEIYETTLEIYFQNWCNSRL